MVIRKLSLKEENELRWGFVYIALIFFFIALFLYSIGGVGWLAIVFVLFAALHLWAALFASQKVIVFISFWIPPQW